MSEAMREEFEAWAKPRRFNLTPGVNQDYWTGRTQGAWLAWQAASAKRDGWIRVADCLPEKNTEVMVFFDGVSSLASTGQYTGSVHDHDGWCYPRENFDDASGEWPKVTHWQPLPPPPQATGKAEGGV